MLKKVIIFSLLLICLMAFPGSAWECTFQDHPDDAYPDCIYGTPTAILIENGTNRYYQTSYATQFVNIAGDYSDYFAFTYYMSGSAAWDGIEITPYYANGTAASSALYIAKPSSTYTGTVRYQFQRIGTTSQFYCLRDGVQISTPTLWASNADIAYIKFSLKADGSSSVMRLDDISTDDVFILGFNNYVNPGSNLTITSGAETYNYFNFYLKIIDDEGNTVYTSPSFSSTTAVYNITAPEDGNYTVRIMGYNSSLSNPAHYIFYSKVLDVSANTPDVSAIVEFSKDEYAPDETVRVSSHLSPYNSGYSVVYKTFYNYEKHSITKEDQSFSFVAPNDGTNYVFAYLIDSKGDVLSSDQAEIPVSSGTVELQLDKDTYTNNETLYAYYKNVPLGADLVFNFYKNGAKVISYSYDRQDIVGYYAFPLGIIDADTVVVNILSGNSVLASDSANILIGNYFLSGKVYDAVNGAAIESATVFTSSFSVNTDENGAYNHSVSPGLLNVTVAATGYETLHTAVDARKIKTVKDFYLVPEYVSENGNSVYGSVTDYYTGSPVEGAVVSLINGSTVYRVYVDNYGYFVFNKAGLTGIWSLKVENDDYDTYYSSVDVSGDVYKNIRLVPTAGVPDIGYDDSTDAIDDTNYSAQPYGAMGRHPFDFNGDGEASADEWKYAFERLIILVGCLCFMGFLGIVGRAGRR